MSSIRYLLVSLFFATSFSLVYGQTYKVSDHYDGKTFFNPGSNDLKSFWDVLKWKLTSDSVSWPPHESIIKDQFRPLSIGEKVSATFINHATFLLQFSGINVLTDPVYSERVSPFSFLGPKRFKPPGISFEKLPNIDVVVISHNHYDHLDLETLKRLDATFHPLFLVPLGDEKLLQEEGIQNVKAMEWWDEVTVKSVKFVFAPAKHWSARHLWDKNHSLWGSFMIMKGQMKIYHAGDTGHGAHFKEIKDRLGIPDLALLPIGAYRPRWFMKSHHMDPEDAIQAHLDLNSPKSLAMHFGTFKLADEGFDEAQAFLKKSLLKFRVVPEEFLVLEHGETLFW